MRKNNNKPKSISEVEQLFYQYFGETIETIRKDQHLSQKAFLESTGINDNKISKIEHLKCRPSAFEYEQLQYFLGFDFTPYLDNLFNMNKPTSNKSILIEYILKELHEADAETLLSIAKLIFKNGEEKDK